MDETAAVAHARGMHNAVERAVGDALVFLDEPLPAAAG
jgi:hypothetical protein